MVVDLKTNKELWDLFTKKEEYNPEFLDTFQRFSYHFSKHRNVLEPEVSRQIVSDGLKFRYPDDKSFAVCLTHDIDEIRYRKINLIKAFIKSIEKNEIKRAVKILAANIDMKISPICNMEKTMELENRYDARSSFYFLALGRGEHDYNYNVSEIKDELRYIKNSGWEIGLHGGHQAYTDYNKLIKEKDKLEVAVQDEVIGYRNHYLKIKIPDTWEILAKAGFKYDTTLGYVDCIGFRNGMCHPFKPFNLNTNDYIDILEIPLVVMDATLIRYLLLDYQTSWEIIKKVIDTVAELNGVITILWHNTYMFDEMLELYEMILKYCSKLKAWMTSAREIYSWWTNNY